MSAQFAAREIISSHPPTKENESHPAARADQACRAAFFIFTVLAEEWGFAGALTLIALYGIILYAGIRAMLVARDRFGFLLCAGLVGMLFFHVLVNVGMTIGIMPITGIPLPFMSYGGSAVLTDFAAVGVLLNIYSQKDRDVLGNA